MEHQMFRERFNEDTFIKFIVNLLNLDNEDMINRIYKNTSTAFHGMQYIKDVGFYKDDNGKDILVSIIHSNKSIIKNRSTQRNYISDHMKDVGADAVICAVYSDANDLWRLSFVKAEYEFVFGDLGGFKVLENFTPPTRFSYLIDPNLKNHTAQVQLNQYIDEVHKKLNLADIENIFSIEAVNQEFYSMYKSKYAQLCSLISEEDARHLLFQIIFIIFIQKKGWLGVKAFPDKLSIMDLCELLCKANPDIIPIVDKAYYVLDNQAILDSNANFNGEAIAGLLQGYSDEWGEGSQTFLRDFYNYALSHNLNFYNDCLVPLFKDGLNQLRNSDYFELLRCKIPFIGSYLFECNDMSIPNKYFSNSKGTGLLDFLDLYNFTTSEDSDLDKDLAVDIDMISKIFEVLVTKDDITQRGMSYTPKSLVIHMCQQSLIEYISSVVDIDKTAAALLVKHGSLIADADVKLGKVSKMPDSIINNIDKIDEALKLITVVDPSSGSGAFCQTMLNQIVGVREVITSYFRLLGKSIRGRSRYRLKRHALQNSIFAVDIDERAVEITRFRLLLDLIVDSDVSVLPNLEMNIVQGDSLVEEFNGVKLFDLSSIDPSKPDAIKVAEALGYYVEDQNRLFNEIDKINRKSLLSEMQYYEHNLIKYMVNGRLNQDDLEDEQYLLWDLVFNGPFAQGGFDIVLGEPPSISESSNSKLFINVKNTNAGRAFYNSKMDYSYFFMHKGLDLAKPGGIVSFVLPDYSENVSGMNIRKDMKLRSSLMSCLKFKSSTFVRYSGSKNYLVTVSRKGKYKDYCAYTANPNSEMVYISQEDIYSDSTGKMIFGKKDIVEVTQPVIKDVRVKPSKDIMVSTEDRFVDTTEVVDKPEDTVVAKPDVEVRQDTVVAKPEEPIVKLDVIAKSDVEVAAKPEHEVAAKPEDTVVAKSDVEVKQEQVTTEPALTRAERRQQERKEKKEKKKTSTSVPGFTVPERDINVLNEDYYNRKIKYRRFKYDDFQNDEIERGLKAGVDISMFAKPEFTAMQMKEIRIGLEQGVDVKSYAKPEISPSKMSVIRKESSVKQMKLE